MTLLSTGYHAENRIFVTGVSGSGKTTFAKQYSNRSGLEYFSFDAVFHYDKLTQDEDRAVLQKLPERFITDAIPFGIRKGGYSIEPFLQYCEDKGSVLIICLCCTDRKAHKERLASKHYKSIVQGFADFYWFYLSGLERFEGLNIVYYDSFSNEYVEKEELLRRIEWIKPLSEFI